MQEDKIIQLQQLIRASSVLVEAEKSDWIHSLPVMNDKQLADLEMILKAHPPAPKAMAGGLAHSTAAPVAPLKSKLPLPPKLSSLPKAPSLSHIANLPAFIAEQPISASQAAQSIRSSVKPTPPVAVPWEQKLEHMIQEKELPPAPSHEPLAPPHEKPFSPLPQPKKPKAVFTIPSITPKPIPKQAFVQPPHTQDDFWAQVVGSPSMLNKKEKSSDSEVHLLRKVEEPPQAAFESPSDVEKMSRESLSALPWDQLISALQQLVRNHGFVVIQFAFEKSPLYQAYIETGHALLEKNMTYEQYAQSSKPSLSKDEFEKVVDLVRKIQVN